MILLCLASSTTPRRRNLLVALAQYTETHFRSSSWFLSSLLLNRGSLNRGSNVVQFIRGKKASFPIPVLQAPVVQTLDSAIQPCGMQLHFLRKSNIGQTNVTTFFSSRAPLPWLNSDSFPPRPMIFITSGILNTKFDRRLQPVSVDLSIITFCRSRSYSYGSEAGLTVSDYCIQSGPEPGGWGGGERDSPYERGGDARRKF